MIKRGKKALSNIIATLLIILLVLVATGIVWVVIKNIISQGAEEISTGQFTIDLKIVSINQTSTDVNVKVKRNTGAGDLYGIYFVIFDGNETHSFEKTDVGLEELEMKTFVLDYTGNIVYISIAAMFKLSSGEITIGNVLDTYYPSSGISDSSSGGGCTPDCTGKECGDDGCGGSCGTCDSDETCVSGNCESSGTSCTPDCSCVTETCIGQTCSDGCEGSCPGTLTLESDCGSLMCGESPHSCGDCGECEQGYHCDGGICVVSCVPDCGTRECGAVPNGCGESCGECNTTAGEWCDEGYCSTEECEPDCDGKECGDDGCGNVCGTCDTENGEWCDEGLCISEETLNSGTVYSVWPIGIGIYFDSPDLPKSGASYTNYYVKFLTGSEIRCLQIRDFVTPIVPEVYNMSYIRFVTSSTSVESGDIYEVWETYTGCTTG